MTTYPPLPEALRHAGRSNNDMRTTESAGAHLGGGSHPEKNALSAWWPRPTWDPFAMTWRRDWTPPCRSSDYWRHP